MKRFCPTISFILIILLIFLFGGCSSDNYEPSPKTNAFEGYSTNESTENFSSIAISSNVISNEESTTLKYNGTPIEVEYEFGSDGNCEMGLILFVNGKLQEYTVDGTLKSMHCVKLKKDETKTFKFSFTPIEGKSGEELQLNLINVFNPIIKTSSGNDSGIIFGSDQSFSQPMPWKIKMNADVSQTKKSDISNEYETQNMTQEEISKYIETDREGNIKDKRQLLWFNLNTHGEKAKPKLQLEDKTNIQLQLCKNDETIYRVSFFADFKPIKMNGFDYYDVIVKKDQYTNINISFDKSEIEGYNNIFAVAVALDSIDGANKTDSVYLVY